MSYVALDRIAEIGARNHPLLKEKLKQTDVPRMSLGKTLTDEELLGKLGGYGVNFTRTSFRKIASEYLSAEALSQWVHKKYLIKDNDQQVDWVWISLAVLWERWFPEQPSLEMIDDRMQKGYTEKENNNFTQAINDWLWTWNLLLEIAQEQDIHSVREFDHVFGGTQSLFNWSQDFDNALWDMGLKEPKFLQERIQFAEGFIKQFRDTYFVRRFIASAADTYFKLGEKEKAYHLFEESLGSDPKWGWGWIHWSDCYQMKYKSNPPILERSEGILKQGLAVPGVEDRFYMLERLVEVLDDMRKVSESETFKVELENARLEKAKHEKKTVRTAPDIPRIPRNTKSLSQPAPKVLVKVGRKVGRNEPCLCGSGKKFKKCCLL